MGVGKKGAATLKPVVSKKGEVAKPAPKVAPKVAPKKADPVIRKTLKEVKITAPLKYSKDTLVSVGGVGKPSLTVPKAKLDSALNANKGNGTADIKKTIAQGTKSLVKGKGKVQTKLSVNTRGDAGSNTYEIAKRLKK